MCVSLQGCNRRHPTLLSLVTHHATEVEFLPTKLSLGSTNPMAHGPAHSQQQLPYQEGVAPPGYPWAIDSDDSDMDDDEMVDQLQRLQLIHP